MRKEYSEHTIKLSKDTKATIHYGTNIPFPIFEKLKETLHCLEMVGVVSKINRHTEWVNSLVAVEKKHGLLKICAD